MELAFLTGIAVGVLLVGLGLWFRPSKMGVIRFLGNKDRRFGSARGYGWVRVRVGDGPPRMLAMTQPEYDKMLERALANPEDQVAGAP